MLKQHERYLPSVDTRSWGQGLLRSTQEVSFGALNRLRANLQTDTDDEVPVLAIQGDGALVCVLTGVPETSERVAAQAQGLQSREDSEWPRRYSLSMTR